MGRDLTSWDIVGRLTEVQQEDLAKRLGVEYEEGWASAALANHPDMGPRELLEVCSEPEIVQLASTFGVDLRAWSTKDKKIEQLLARVKIPAGSVPRLRLYADPEQDVDPVARRRDLRDWWERELAQNDHGGPAIELRPGEAHLLVPYRHHLLSSIGLVHPDGEAAEVQATGDVPEDAVGDTLAEALVVQRVLAYAMGGLSRGGVVERLHAEGTQTLGGRPITEDLVRAILDSQEYECQSGATLVIPAEVLTTVGRELRRRDPLETNPGTEGRARPFRDHLYCECGTQIEPGGTKDRRTYQCPQAKKDDGSCSWEGTSEPDLDRQVVEELSFTIFSRERAGRMLEALVGEEGRDRIDDEAVASFTDEVQHLFEHDLGLARRFVRLHVSRITVRDLRPEIEFYPPVQDDRHWPAPLWYLTCHLRPPRPRVFVEITRDGEKPAKEIEVYRRRLAEGELDLLIDATGERCWVTRPPKEPVRLSSTASAVLILLVKDRTNFCTVKRLADQLGSKAKRHYWNIISDLNRELRRPDEDKLVKGKRGEGYRFAPSEEIRWVLIEPNDQKS